MNEKRYYQLDSDIIEGPESAGMKLATAVNPTEAERIVEIMNNAHSYAGERIAELEDLLTSARSIAERQGAGTAWERFSARLKRAGIGSITPKTFRTLPSDRS